MSLRGKVTIVTGSTAGIGRSIAEHLASLEAHVVITSRNIDTARGVANEIASNGGSVTYQCFELENIDSGRMLIDKVIEKQGRLDFLVNNAISRPTPLSSELMQGANHKKMHDYITYNITHMLALTLNAYPHLKRSKGAVLNIGSVIVNRHILGTLLYSIVKGAMTQMTKALAAEWANDRIRVNQINPGFVITDSFQRQIPETYARSIVDAYKQHHPVGQVGDAGEISVLAGHIVSNELRWMTGSVVDIDGGYSVEGISNPIEMLMQNKD